MTLSHVRDCDFVIDLHLPQTCRIIYSLHVRISGTEWPLEFRQFLDTLPPLFFQLSEFPASAGFRAKLLSPSKMSAKSRLVLYCRPPSTVPARKRGSGKYSCNGVQKCVLVLKTSPVYPTEVHTTQLHTTHAMRTQQTCTQLS